MTAKVQTKLRDPDSRRLWLDAYWMTYSGNGSSDRKTAARGAAEIADDVVKEFQRRNAADAFNEK